MESKSGPGLGNGERIVVWHAKDGWRWTHWSSNDVIAESGEGYDNKSYAVEMADKQGKGDVQIILKGEEAV